MAERHLWVGRDAAPAEFAQQFPELSPVAVQLLFNRGLQTQAEVDQFLTPDYSTDQHDPSLFAQMQIAVDRIALALEQKERIVIHGDYDADGVCGAAVLYKTLAALDANLDVYLPHRDTEGYGLNMNSVQSLADNGTNLIITVDCGISNKPEVARAVELGMEVIVTDHHSEPPELPDQALAILNPKISTEPYPFKYLAGVGVAFKLCQALIKKYGLGEAFEKWLLDIVAISTVTDFVPLIGENRLFLRYGLVVLRKNQRPGLRQLFAVIGEDPKQADTHTIGFKIGPHINAAGRVKHANMAFELMIEEDATKAADFARALAKTNKERQQLSDKMAKEALAQAAGQTDASVIIVDGDSWPVGLVGLVAGRVASTYNRPAFVITTMGNEIVGSGRSIEQFNVVEALQGMDELFSKYGGHPMACGFSLKNADALADFKQRMRELADAALAGRDLRKSLSVELVLQLPQVDWPLVETLEQFAPFGEGNPEPVFVSRGVRVEDFSCVGRTKSHLRLTISQGGVRRKGIGFHCGEWAEKIARGDEIDLAYTVDVNEWNGNREIQLKIRDIEIPS
jgi:single-stranded-DNA-specific exonuclease